ncbi:CotH kinase family protein [Peribacillus alkalitolerans]|uniref:CotH kinase family protein n=1 Tax=Peribacillus alkalitolerans TaxID=1550385 RepID=UPI0013D8BB83|nr:CotH kinase family protein [Peribacillus alkalitolerans]
MATLPKYFITINPKDLASMKEDIWNEDYKMGRLLTGTENYKINISLRGNQTRKHPKKSYHIVFKQPFFMEGQHEIHLNAEFNDISLIRNKLSLDFFNRIGVLAPNSKHVLLYINGFFQGIYLQLESFDQFYLQKRKLPKGSIYYATNDDANFSLITPEHTIKTTLTDGYTPKLSIQSDEQLKLFIAFINTVNQEQFCNDINQFIDIDKYLKWLAGVVCTQNFDGFIHNYAIYQNSKTNLFELSPWDYDGSWGRDLHGHPLSYDYIPIQGYNTLSGRLLDCKLYRKKYKEILKEILENHFTTHVIQPYIEELHSLISPFVSDDPFVKDRIASFSIEKNFILDFISKRKQYLTNELQGL